MSNHTIGGRRGSIRGPPPRDYIPFGAYNPDERYLRETITFFGNLLKFAILFLFAMFVCVIYVAFTEDPY